MFGDCLLIPQNHFEVIVGSGLCTGGLTLDFDSRVHGQPSKINMSSHPPFPSPITNPNRMWVMGWGDGEGERRQTSFGLRAHSWEFTQATTGSPACD